MRPRPGNAARPRFVAGATPGGGSGRWPRGGRPPVFAVMVGAAMHDDAPDASLRKARAAAGQ